MYKSKSLLVLASIISVAAFFLLVSSCHKKNKDITEDTSYAPEQSSLEKTFNDVEDISYHAYVVSAGSLNYRTSSTTSMGCATVQKSGDSIIVDFGSVNCVCHDGRSRRGRIIVINDGKYMDSGSTHKITFDNFYQNDNKVTGSKTVTNMGHNSIGQPWFSVSVNGAITLAGGGTVKSVWNRTRTWTDGYATPTDFSDDVYSIYGTGTMTRTNGTEVTINIPAATPLVMAAGCKWIESGTIIFTLPGGATRSLNYGTKAVCDPQAQLTLANGKVINITKP